MIKFCKNKHDTTLAYANFSWLFSWYTKRTILLKNLKFCWIQI